MNSNANVYSNIFCETVTPTHSYTSNLKLPSKSERKILKAFLLGRFHQLFFELFHGKIQTNQNNYPMECYTMDSKIIQILIQGIIETGEYTLEGIAYYTHIPFDVIYDAACGISNQFSITPWARIVDLYTQLRPDVTEMLISKLIETKNNNHLGISSLLNET